MDEDLTLALAAAGDVLAHAVRSELSRRGLPDDVHICASKGRIMIGSGSLTIRDAELGQPGSPPRPSLAMAGRSAAGEAIDGIAAALRGSLA